MLSMCSSYEKIIVMIMIDETSDAKNVKIHFIMYIVSIFA